MRSRYKFDIEKGLYFITSTIIEFIPVFTSDKYFQIITDSLNYCRINKEIKIFAYVIIDNHFHLLISGENLSNKIRSLKRHTAKEIIEKAKKDNKQWLLNQFSFYKKRYKKNSAHQVWQEGAHPQIITEIDIAEQKINYIHYNPVKRGLVKEPQDWRYSSAGNYFYGDGVLEIDRFEEL